MDTTSTVRLLHTVNMNSNRAIENLKLCILKGLSPRAMAIMALRDAAMAVRVAWCAKCHPFKGSCDSNERRMDGFGNPCTQCINAVALLETKGCRYFIETEKFLRKYNCLHLRPSASTVHFIRVLGSLHLNLGDISSPLRAYGKEPTCGTTLQCLHHPKCTLNVSDHYASWGKFAPSWMSIPAWDPTKWNTYKHLIFPQSISQRQTKAGQTAFHWHFLRPHHPHRHLPFWFHRVERWGPHQNTKE